jgi:hypothetical protein
MTDDESVVHVVPVTLEAEAISGKQITSRQAMVHCKLTLNIEQPSAEDVEKALKRLNDVQKRVKAAGITELKSEFAKQAAARNIKKRRKKGDNGQPGSVDSFQDLSDRWKAPESMTLELCKQVYELLYEYPDSTCWAKWLSDAAIKIKCNEKLDIVTDAGSDGSPKFIQDIIMGPCLSGLRKFVGCDRSTKMPVSITKRKSLPHPMGTWNRTVSTFQFQNVLGWERLCELDPVAQSISDEFTKLKGKTDNGEKVQDTIDRHRMMLLSGMSTGSSKMSTGDSKSSSEQSKKMTSTHKQQRAKFLPSKGSTQPSNGMSNGKVAPLQQHEGQVAATRPRVDNPPSVVTFDHSNQEPRRVTADAAQRCADVQSLSYALKINEHSATTDAVQRSRDEVSTMCQSVCMTEVTFAFLPFPFAPICMCSPTNSIFLVVSPWSRYAKLLQMQYVDVLTES